MSVAATGDAPGTADTGPDAVLRVENLTCTIDTPVGTARILRGIDLELAPGESLGLVGESGSGKTMLVKCLMGLAPAAATVSGRAVLGGRDLLSLPPGDRRRVLGKDIAMVFQDPMSSLNPVVRIGRQLTEGMRFHLKISKAEAYARAEELLAVAGIPDPKARLRMYPHELSGGMRQRVMIAIALSCDPAVLIADEATTALDVTVQKQILDLLQELQRERGMSLILVSHDLGVVAGRTDRVAVMYAGGVVEVAATRDLFRRSRHRYSRALLGAIPVMGGLGRRLTTIPGRMPSATSPQPGCGFAPRCGSAVDRCRAEPPPPVLEADGHEYRCVVPAPLGATGATTGGSS
ncbi:ABC transporter ATP-binding protein [Pseudonocardia ailaonensis]|uniref:ABC transporter ATP-binding protein n=1 Tax=Pseudonocardia ailaonensis TaxID=367279 RepID=A0ABN2MHQ2_9PSEU